MTNSGNISRIKNGLIVLLMLALATVIISCGDDDDPNGPDNPPVISVFQANPIDITPGDSTLLTYRVTEADSVVLFPDGTKLASASNGSVYAKPALPTEYTLVAYNSKGTDSASVVITMNAVVPAFVSFTVDPEVIPVGDSVLIAWEVVRADSLVIDNGGGKSTLADDSKYVKPSLNTVYTGIAYNAYGTDTAVVTVDVPFSFAALNGQYYKGSMNSSVQDPLMQFQVEDINGAVAHNALIQAEIVEGDGTLSADSFSAGLSDTAFMSYDFDGTLGHAVLRTWVDGLDTTNLFIRARTIIPGEFFQGQYILAQDTYALVQEYYGIPDAVVDPEPGSGYLVLDYESTDSIVFLVFEVGAINGQVSAMDIVFKILITGSQTASTTEGVSVGSTYPELFAAFGAPDSSDWNPSYPFDTLLIYTDLGLTFWCDRADTIVNQIDITFPDSVLGSPGKDNVIRERDATATADRKYKLIY